MKQSLRTCVMGLVGGCIDPCRDHNCPNLLAVQFDEKGEPIEETFCVNEQGDENCYKIACPTCKYFEPRGTDLENMMFLQRPDTSFGNWDRCSDCGQCGK